MSQKFHDFVSLFVNKIGCNCNKTIIIKAAFGSILFISQIVLSAIGIDNGFVTSILALAAFYVLLTYDTRTLSWLGFFLIIFGYYWIGFSFHYFGFTPLIPLVILALAGIYMFIFWLFAKISSFAGDYFTIARAAVGVFYFDLIAPFGFDWIKPELFLADSYFGVTKIHLALIFGSLALLATIKNNKRYLSLTALLFAIQFESPKALPNIKIELASTNVSFENKYKEETLIANFNIINKAISDGADLIVLPETSFAYALNKSPELLEPLLERSHKIAILCGSIRVDGEDVYNSNYLFKDGNYTTYDKVIGVPFGEINPLPQFLSSFINDIFFNGISDFKTAKEFSDFEVKGVRFRNAVCYEATKEEAYKGNPKQIIALSNNAWFMPSLEPILQKKLIKYYSRLHNTTVYHAVNMSPSYIVK